MRPLEIVRQDGCVRWIGPAKCHIGESDGMFFPYLDISEELAREFAVTLLRKEVIRLRQEAEKAPYNMGRSHSCFVAAEALEAKIEQFVETGIWPEPTPEPLRGGGE